jgi:uncharacterized protein DUF6130
VAPSALAGTKAYVGGATRCRTWCKENMNSFQEMNHRGHIKRIGALIAIAVALFALAAAAQSAKEVKGATPLVAIQNEAAARLIVDPPIPEQLALGRVFIRYRTKNLRILPVFGGAALSVSARIGHLHYYVDGQSWPIVDTSGETVVLVGLKPGPHTVKLELADATHKAVPGASEAIEFTVPQK